MKLKKLMILVCLFLSVSIFMEANYLKAIGGITSSKNSFSGYDTESELSLTGGIGIETGLGKSRFVAEVLFSYENVGIEANGVVTDYRFVKLTMPLLYKHRFRKVNSPYGIIGGAGTIIFADSLASDGKTNSLFDFSIVIGAGMEIDLINKKKILNDENYQWPTIVIEGRYQKGLKDLKLDERDFSTSSLYILFGIKF